MSSTISSETSIIIQAPIAKVWAALTDPELIRKYFFGTNTVTDWQKGSPIFFRGEWEGKSYEDKGTIRDIEQFKMIKYDYWSSMSGTEDKPENYATITYLLSGEDGNVKLTVLQDNIRDEKTKEHSEGNWKMVLKGLKDLVEGK